MRGRVTLTDLTIYLRWARLVAASGVLSMFFATLSAAQPAEPLEVTVFLPQTEFLGSEEIPVTVTLTNISEGIVVIPDIDDGSVASYIQVDIFHEIFGPAFFFEPFSEEPFARALTTTELVPGAMQDFEIVLNAAGSGPLAYPNPGEPDLVSGVFDLLATFFVEDENLPLGGNAAVFRGSVTSETVQVAIELEQMVTLKIKPGDEQSTINFKNMGIIPVAVFSVAGFDAPIEIDQSSLTFGRTGNEESVVNCTVDEDVNWDGLRDLVCHVDTELAGFQQGDSKGVLKGETFMGNPILGIDFVRVK